MAASFHDKAGVMRARGWNLTILVNSGRGLLSWLRTTFFLDELPLPRRGLGDKGSEWSGSETIESSSNRYHIPYLIAIGRYL